MTDKEFLTLAFLLHGRTIPDDANIKLEDAYDDPEVSTLGMMEEEGLVIWNYDSDFWFHITDKGMALIGEDND